MHHRSGVFTILNRENKPNFTKRRDRKKNQLTNNFSKVLLTNSMEQSFLKAKVHYVHYRRIHKRLHYVPIRMQIYPVFVSQTNFSTLHFNIILKNTPRSSKGFFYSRLPPKTLRAPILSPIHATCSAYYKE